MRLLGTWQGQSISNDDFIIKNLLIILLESRFCLNRIKPYPKSYLRSTFLLLSCANRDSTLAYPLSIIDSKKSQNFVL